MGMANGMEKTFELAFVLDPCTSSEKSEQSLEYRVGSMWTVQGLCQTILDIKLGVANYLRVALKSDQLNTKLIQLLAIVAAK